MSFSPHEFERSHEPVSSDLMWHEPHLFDHKIKHIGGWVLLHQEHRSESVFYFEACAQVAEQLDRLDMLSDKETLHHITEDGQDTWVAAVRSNGNGRLPKRHVRVITNRAIDFWVADGDHVPGLERQDFVLDRIRQKVGIRKGSAPEDPVLFAQRANRQTPPQIDIAKFYNGEGVRVSADPGYIPPFPVNPSGRLLQQLYAVNRDLLVLADLLSQLGVGTEQQSPVWYKHRDV